MEFAILTQNKSMIVPFKDTIEIEKLYGDNRYHIYMGTTELGNYDSEDRAKQVIDTICNDIYSGSPIFAMPDE